jgi:hypothetical protein
VKLSKDAFLLGPNVNRLVKNPDSRVFKKVQMRGAHFIVIVSVKRDREDRTSTNTLHKHEFNRAQRSRWAFFNSL